MNHGSHAIVIGGGIGGPAVSLFLRRAGIESRIFEAYPEPATAGGGFQIAPNGIRVLNTLGLADRVRAAGVTSSNFVFRNQHGKVISQIDVSGSGYGVTLTRAAFQRILLDEIGRQHVPIEYASAFAASNTKAMSLWPASTTAASSKGAFCWPLTACILWPVR